MANWRYGSIFVPFAVLVPKWVVYASAYLNSRVFCLFLQAFGRTGFLLCSEKCEMPWQGGNFPLHLLSRCTFSKVATSLKKPYELLTCLSERTPLLFATETHCWQLSDHVSAKVEKCWWPRCFTVHVVLVNVTTQFTQISTAANVSFLVEPYLCSACLMLASMGYCGFRHQVMSASETCTFKVLASVCD